VAAVSEAEVGDEIFARDSWFGAPAV
jgi:hypothetical protein